MKVTGVDKTLFNDWGCGNASEMQQKANRLIAEIAVRETLKSAIVEVETYTPVANINIVMLSDAYNEPVYVSFPISDIEKAIRISVDIETMSVEQAALIKAALLKAAEACDRAKLTRDEIGI